MGAMRAGQDDRLVFWSPPGSALLAVGTYMVWRERGLWPGGSHSNVGTGCVSLLHCSLDKEGLC